jgi:hypothetical protein
VIVGDRPTLLSRVLAGMLKLSGDALWIDEKHRLNTPLAAIEQFNIDLPVLVISEAKQQFTGPPLTLRRPVTCF